MKRSNLEEYIGKRVAILLFDDRVISGELHKSGEDAFRNDPNLYLPRNLYFVMTDKSNFSDVSCLFRSSHVKKLMYQGEIRR